MKRSPIIRFTKYLLDFMFFCGIVICAGVPYLFSVAGRYFSIFEQYYVPFCIVFMIAGIFALLILWELRRMFQTVLKEDPFVRRNVTSLKRMGYYAFAIAMILTVRLLFVITPAALVLVAVFLIAGLFSLVLSLVFDQAVTYKLDNDLTI